MAVALVFVSHSALLAQGTIELAGQMAPDVALLPAAGTLEGGLGTSLDVVTGAVERALAEVEGPDQGGVVVLADLGSAVLTVESALELEDDWSGRVVLADAPFVEGAVAAAVAAQQGGSLHAVLAAAQEAGGTFSGSDVTGADGPRATGPLSVAPLPDEPSPGGPPSSEPSSSEPDADGVVTARVAVRNPLGLHARPAAQLARAVAELGVPVSVGGVDGASVLQLLALGATGGKELEVSARGPGAQEAVRTVVGLIAGGFGEV